MTLAPGSRLGPYEVTAKLGEGGMGEVYLARDTHLDRQVAIKVLPDAFARDADRLARFKREAQALAALNDPHIAQIYRLEEVGPSVALVMEFVDGQTLAEIIAARGPGLSDSLTIARQIASGLESAHERGIVHRDLKPANVKIASTGQVKILDFGLAKAMSADPTSSDLMNSPTLTARATEAGMILGTAAYMSPEQARGKTVDKRTDIWAFGAVLFEMLTHRRAFEGETVSDTLAAILRSDPDWTQLPADVPPHVRALLHRCLERDPSRRLRDIGEARLALEGGAAAASGVAVLRPSAPARRPWMWMGAAAFFAATTIFFAATSWVPRSGAPATDSYELALAPPDDAAFRIGSNSGNVIISPDGTRIAFVAATSKGGAIWVRSLATDDARPLSGTNGAQYPFWSPDGRRLGFFARSKLQTVEISGGLPEHVADAPNGRGGSWGEDDTILFTPVGGGVIQRVKATGGAVTPVTTLDAARGDDAHYWPVFLPGGQRFIYFIRSTRVENGGIYLSHLDGSAPAVRLVSSLSSGVPAIRPSTGGLYLMWAREDTLLAQPLDAEAATLRGEVSTIATGVLVQESQRLMFASASRSGTIAWATARAATEVLSVYERDGRRTRTLDIAPGGSLHQPAVSPDGQRLLFTKSEKGSADVFLHDLRTSTTQRVTTDPGYEEWGVWTPDGLAMIHIGWSPDRKRSHLRTVLNDGAQPSVANKAFGLGAGFETPAPRFLVFTAVDPNTGSDILASPLDASGAAVPLAAGPGHEQVLSMSGDGKWLLMVSDKGGRRAATLRRFVSDRGAAPRLGAELTPPGENSRWVLIRPDGRELYGVTPDRMLQAIALTPKGDTLTLDAPKALFKLPEGDEEFSVSPDGKQFIISETPFSAGQTLRVLTHWEKRLSK